MTIAVGLRCGDGVVLASDSQWTGNIKRNAAKVWLLNKGDDNYIGLACAGDGDLITRFVYDIESALKPGMSYQQIFDLADGLAYATWAKHLKNDPDADLQLLLAIRTPETGVAVFQCVNAKQFSPFIGTFECIGVAARPLGLYIVDRLFDGSTIRRARSVAAYTLAQTKKYDPANTVSGASQMLVLPAELTVAPQFVPPEIIQQLEAQLERYDDAMCKMLASAPGVVGVDVNTETRARRDETLDTALSAATAFYLNAEPGHYHVEGHPPTIVIKKKDDPEKSSK